MKCKECDKDAFYKAAQLCKPHYERKRHLARLDKLKVTVCQGDCGRRVHNIKYVTIPGILQGHGPNSEWCDVCRRKYRPSSTSNPYRGNCSDCGQPMMIGDVEPGFVQFWGKGRCLRDYWRFKKGYKGTGAVPRAKLSTEDVLEIRRRYATGENQGDIARDFEILRGHVSKIGRRVVWQSIP